jgi:hypothetical protein
MGDGLGLGPGFDFLLACWWMAQELQHVILHFQKIPSLHTTKRYVGR